MIKDNTVRNRFAVNLSELRRNKKITQSTMAVMLGISVGAYRHYENGRNEPNYATLSEIIRILDTDFNYILGYSYLENIK